MSEEQEASELVTPSEALNRAFGSDSRREMLEEYFAGAGAVTPANAWIHVYRLLLWIDRTISLAHCYESDKCQPGRAWYSRSLAFHDWVSTALGHEPAELGANIDWLFGRGAEKLARIIARQQPARERKAAEQRAAYSARNLPAPWEDPTLDRIIAEELGTLLKSVPPAQVMRRLTQRIRMYLAEENKRKNLVGEGFEDVLASLIARIPGGGRLAVRTRPVLHELPGFRPPRQKEKTRKVDLAIVGPAQERILISAKWSVRADREEQFGTDMEAYARLEDASQPFSFVLVTNEFDAARLVAACDRPWQNGPLFQAVVHVNPEGPLAAYGKKRRGKSTRLDEIISNGRLISLERWLSSLPR